MNRLNRLRLFIPNLMTSKHSLSSIFRQNRQSESQSDLLSSTDTIFELQIHDVKSKHLHEYIRDYETYLMLLTKTDSKSELIGSWISEIGPQDCAYHLWRYSGGYPSLMAHIELCKCCNDLNIYQQRLNAMLHSRRNQICLAFSYWPELVPRLNEHNIYELRSYSLHPGTLVEWGNNWVRGIKIRSKSNEPVAGLFTHIGDLHVVHHFWAYKDLEARRKARDDVWQDPGWTACVMNTVPLVRRMTSTILLPTPFSQLQ